jgi:nitrogen fixation NifU-like protein
MKTELAQLYNERILALNKSAYHFEKMDSCDILLEANNPICGDDFKIYLQVENNKITTAHFYGFGCALSKASTSILVKDIEGMPVEEAVEHARKFLDAMETSKKIGSDDIDLLIALKNHKGRVDCIKLSWETLARYTLP